jgi:cation diffusion facilitator family transporter
MKSRAVVYISLATDILIAVSKFIAASFSHSSAMISEGIHSIIDAVSQLLLILGFVKASKPPDDKRPFGYGRELYFWSFIVSLLIFVLGGCISFYQGIIKIRKNGPVHDNAMMDYIVLAIAILFNTISLLAALKTFNKQRGDVPFWKAVKLTKDPSTIIVLLGDVGDILGLIVAFVGVLLRELTHDSYYDGFASIVIGVILVSVSAILVRESKSLLMGESIGKKTLREIIALAEKDESVVKVKKNFSIYMAPEDVLLQLNAVFKRDLTTQQLTASITRISEQIKQDFPKVKQVFIEPVL